MPGSNDTSAGLEHVTENGLHGHVAETPPEEDLAHGGGGHHPHGRQ